VFSDFREYYNLRLTDVYRFDGSLPVWEAAILMKQLPPSSRTMAALQGGREYWGWDVDRYMLAALLDAMNINTYAFVSANSKKKVKAPVAIPRPGDAERKALEAQNNPFAQIVKSQLKKLQ
jgi:hypothetical protein